MTRLAAAAVVVLILGGTARADMGLPWPLQHYIPVRITLTVDPPPPGVVLFIQDTGPIRRMPPTSPIVIESRPGSAGAGFTVYAVPARVVESWFDGAMPHRDWFGRHDNPDCKSLGGGVGRGRVDFNDGRSAIELEYRLVRVGDEMRVVKVSENEPSAVYRGAATLGCCCAVPLGIAWLGVWLVRRVWRAAGGRAARRQASGGADATGA